jgi:tRNA (adenine57-N1/adenine58-N1)-methyltransferase catalytic subunit
MEEMAQKRIEVRREYSGLQYEGLRGVNAVAATVDQALSRLREVEMRSREYRAGRGPGRGQGQGGKERGVGKGKSQEARKLLFNEGVLVHRTEPEVKTHTSYLVFAVLPAEWSERDEAGAREKWARRQSGEAEMGKGKATKSLRQVKREAKLKARVEREANEKEGVMEAAIMEPEGAPFEGGGAVGEEDDSMNIES